jgi:hypothetical protein
MAVLILFAALQYNDPDWYFWGPVYLLAAAWSWLALRQPERFVTWPAARIGAPISIAFFLAGFVSLASYIGPGWIHSEEARESIGYLICAATTSFALLESRVRYRRMAANAAGQAR